MPVMYKALWITIWGVLGLTFVVSHDVPFTENNGDEYPEIDTFDDMSSYQKQLSEFAGPSKKYSQILNDSGKFLATTENQERMKRLSEFLGGPGKRSFDSFLNKKQKLPKRFSEFLGGPGKRFTQLYEDPEKRFSEFLGGPGKRFSEFLGGPGKRFSEFLGGPGKRSILFPYEIHPEHVHSATKRLSEFLGGPGK
ncbi:uncharacterized protein LOC143243957 [Tachypleus tridentatus]|uniref:uncharacterized protein LOC143243957 n=1 Tax=Tachypleus tridentatus TaxID=6853 RepID=UPI003FD04500